MTKEDIVKNFEFKAWKKAMKSKFPFVIDIIPLETWDTDVLEYDVTYFFKAILSNQKILEEHPEWIMWDWMKPLFERKGKVMDLIYLSELYHTDVENVNPGEVMEEFFEFSSKFHHDLGKQVAVPQELKSPRSMMIQRYDVVE